MLLLGTVLSTAAGFALATTTADAHALGKKKKPETPIPPKTPKPIPAPGPHNFNGHKVSEGGCILCIANCNCPMGIPYPETPNQPTDKTL